MIDAEFRSEERFSRLALAYEGAEEKKRVHTCVESIIANNKLQPDIHTTPISKGREVLVIEYHDDLDRECAPIFENIIKTLEIKICN